MKKEQHILVIRLSAMGDVAMLVHVIIALLKKYPNLRLHILTKAMFVPFFEDLPNTIVHVADIRGRHKSLPGILRLATEIPDRINVIADVHNVIRSKILRRVLSMKGLKNQKIDKGRSEKKALTSSRKKEIKPLISTHQRYANVFEKLGYPVKLKPQHIKAKQAIPQKLLSKLKLTESKKYIGFAPFAAYRSKQLPLEKTNFLLKEIAKMRPDYAILLFGGGSREIELLKQLENQHSSCISVAGKFSFKEELQFIANLKLMISMDSGNGHLAAMYGVPVITLWGGTHPYTGFAPFLQPEENQFTPNLKKYPLLPISVYGNKMIKGYENMMESLDFDAIIARIKKVTQP